MERVLSGLAVAVFGLTACGEDHGSSSSPSAVPGKLATADVGEYGKVVVDGIDASLVSTVTRSDGTKQLAIKGLPLYLFASDSKAGEAKGQAVGGVWWVVGADGQKITTQPDSSGNGYGY